ncbi:MAG: hypothetical protein C4K60_16720 [Ideonella sp. MAG2]|nr:MAG: hypothetical protein C4K60_16720 [Ideonella sp. MAG2]
MQEATFKQLVIEYDHSARHAPGRFTAVTALWAALGQCVILALLLLAMVGLAFAVGHLLRPPFRLSALLWSLIFASLLWSTLAALWLRQSPLPGMEITWASHYRHARRQAALLQDLVQEEALGQGLPLADRLLWARTAWQLEGRMAAREPLMRLMREHPQVDEAHYLVACLELDEADDPNSTQNRSALRRSGLERLEALARQGNSEWALAAARRLEEAYEEGEDFAGLADLRPLRKALEARDQQALEALFDFGGRVELSVPNFSPRVLRPILDVLRREPAVGRAFLLKRTASQAAGWSLYLLVVERKRGVPQPDPQHWWQALEEQIDMPLRLMVADLDHPHWANPARQPLVEHIKRIEGACIYSGRSL